MKTFIHTGMIWNACTYFISNEYNFLFVSLYQVETQLWYLRMQEESNINQLMANGILKNTLRNVPTCHLFALMQTNCDDERARRVCQGVIPQLVAMITPNYNDDRARVAQSYKGDTSTWMWSQIDIGYSATADTLFVSGSI